LPPRWKCRVDAVQGMSAPYRPPAKRSFWRVREQARLRGVALIAVLTLAKIYRPVKIRLVNSMRVTVQIVVTPFAEHASLLAVGGRGRGFARC
jgi:hypothetical protein